MSSISAIPVEMIIGFPVEATFLISGISNISKEAILYAGTFKLSKRFTADGSKGEEKQVIPIFCAYSNSSSCHSQGV